MNDWSTAMKKSSQETQLWLNFICIPSVFLCSEKSKDTLSRSAIVPVIEVERNRVFPLDFFFVKERNKPALAHCTGISEITKHEKTDYNWKWQLERLELGRVEISFSMWNLWLEQHKWNCRSKNYPQILKNVSREGDYGILGVHTKLKKS